MKWFKHQSAARNDERISRLEDVCGLEGYGFYFKTLEIIAESMDETNRDYIEYSVNVWAKKIGVLPSKFKKLAANCSETGLILLAIRVQTDKKLSVKRNEMYKITSPNLLKYRDNHTKNLQAAYKQEEEKEEEKEEEVNTLSDKPDSPETHNPKKPKTPLGESAEVLQYLNEKVGSNFRAVESNIKLIEARIKEGATLDELKRVISSKAAEWKNDPKMAEYLRPSTLFNASKYAQYSGQLSIAAKTVERGLVC